MAEFKEKLQAFLDHYETLSSMGEDAEEGFNSEFQKLKGESQVYKETNTFPAEAGQQPFNKKKNRFKDILPFEYTRVQLHKSEGVEGSDYINANYIQGYDRSVTYIAAQGPLPHTMNDFWRMLWYHQIEIVVMVCKEVEMGRVKCQCYWPPVGESQLFGAIKVTMRQEESVSDDFTVRELLAECQGEEQIIRQYHYSAWPDHGRPASPLPIIRMVERIGDHRKRHDIPIVVHCSAGCGRTGTIIAIDFARSMLLREEVPEELSVQSIVHDMRRQRPSMVQAKDQYVFVYMAVAELIKRILGNVPQAPPKQLKFEMKENKSKPCPNNGNSIYENVTLQTETGSPKAEQKQLSAAELNEPAVNTSKQSPTFPPKPVARTSSGGRPDNNNSREGKPSPPLRPRPPRPARPEKHEKHEKLEKPERPERPETPKKEQPERTPRKRLEGVPVPVPAPRKHSPVPVIPTSTVTPPTTTPTNSGSKGYVNVPSSIQVAEAEATYSVVKKDTSTSSMTSTPKGKASSANTSGSSILDMFMVECVGVFSEEDMIDITGKPPPPDMAEDTSYSMLGTVQEDEIPPEIPVQTIESTQLLIIGETPKKEEGPGQSSEIYETPDPSLISQTQSSTFPSTRSSQPSQQDDVGPSKTKRLLHGGLFKKTQIKEKKYPNEDPGPVGVQSGHQTHPPVGRAHSSHTSPQKRPSEAPPSRRGGANDKYKFPGDLGYGVRVGKPKGPREIPSHWSVPNGLIH